MSKERNLDDKIHLIVCESTREERPNGWSATEMLHELRKRNWINEWCNVLDVAESMKKMYGEPRRAKHEEGRHNG